MTTETVSAGEEWVVIRQTVSNGRRWYLARAGQFCTADIRKAQTYPSREDAQHVVQIEQCDLGRGRGRGGFRVWCERLPEGQA